MGGILKVYGGALVGGLAATALSYIGIELTQEEKASAGTAIVNGLTVGIGLLLSRFTNSKVNPGNAASKTLADQFASEREEIKRSGR